MSANTGANEMNILVVRNGELTTIHAPKNGRRMLARQRARRNRFIARLRGAAILLAILAAIVTAAAMILAPSAEASPSPFKPLPDSGEEYMARNMSGALCKALATDSVDSVMTTTALTYLNLGYSADEAARITMRAIVVGCPGQFLAVKNWASDTATA